MSDDDIFFSANESDVQSNDSFCSITDGLGDVIRQTFNKGCSHLLNVCHINAQSIPSHYSDLLETFTDADIHAVLISETWLKPQLLSTTYPLPGFLLVRNDRLNKRGGGVAIYIRKDLPYKIVTSSSPANSSTAEFLFLEVWVKGAKIILGVVYCPPSVDYFSSLESVLETLGSNYAHHIIMGDFNTDLLAHQSSRSKKLLNILQSASLSVLPLLPTHHNTDGQDTWLDLILTSNTSLVSSHGQYPAPGFSRHDLIFLSYTLKPPKPPPQVLHMRGFGRMDVSKLILDAIQINWDNLMAVNTVDQKVAFFNSTLVNLFDIHAPIRKTKLKRSPALWLTSTVRTAMRRRDRAFVKFRHDRTNDNWAAYKIARNRCNQMIRNAKRRYISDNISSSSPTNIWKFLGTLGIGKQRPPDIQQTIGLDDINRHFTKTIPLDHQVKCRTLNHLASLPSPDIDPFYFSPVATDEIKRIILSIKSNAVGCDNVSRRMIIPILDQLLPPITHIVNFSFSSCAFPSLWRKAHVVPLPKIQNPTLPTHFRPISILPFLSKVLEACAHRQMTRFVHTNNLLSPFQSGFRPGHSTVSALLKVTEDIRVGMEDTKLTILVLVDFSNAFNTVSHDILLSILSYLKISSEALEWFSSYIRGRQQSVKVGEFSSIWCDLHSGVPQGGILSPLLFSIFINLITQDLQCAYHLYADDLQLYAQASVNFIHSAIDKVNRDLTHISSWSDGFGLTVNPSKCQAIIVGSQRLLNRIDITSLPPLVYKGSVIALSPSVKDLGLHIDMGMNWLTQVTYVCRRVTDTLRVLYRLKNFLPLKTKTMLVQALILPIIDYGDVCYFDLNAELLDKLDRLLNNCIRFIFNLRKYDHVSSYRSQLKWLSIRQRRSMRALTLLHSILVSPSPPSYLLPFFQYLGCNHDRNLRSTNNLLLQYPSHSTDFLHSSFVIQTIHLWNALPVEVRTCRNRLAFKVKVRELFFKQTAELSI